ncbi:MAG: protein-(glutamine-N5) methyltransferase, release factor-specific [Actinomycetia bacterium]|nr:protein-(glutamine-N5) methyltransferase, release factor-specific [Actinomycetes bacterium]
MTEEASGYGGADWIDGRTVVPQERAWRRLEAMCERRVAGAPLQYVLGSWSFRGLDLMVDERVLIPRPETEVVVEVALDEAVRLGYRRGPRPLIGREPRGVVADLGTGSGAIALALEAELPEAEVWATDLSEDALAVARANLAGTGAARVRLAAGSWFHALPVELRGRIDLIVSNPPYVADAEFATLPDEVARYEPRRALVSGPAGTEALEHLVVHAPSWLAANGVLVCEIAPHQADTVTEQARRAGFESVEVRPDLTGRLRALIARRTGSVEPRDG